MAGDYIIEIKLPNGSWERSWGANKNYSLEEAQIRLAEIQKNSRFTFRMSPYAVPVPSYLELKGALACLGGAHAACLRSLYETHWREHGKQSQHTVMHDHAAYRDACSILFTAQDAVRAELEAL